MAAAEEAAMGHFHCVVWLWPAFAVHDEKDNADRIVRSFRNLT